MGRLLAVAGAVGVLAAASIAVSQTVDRVTTTRVDDAPRTSQGSTATEGSSVPRSEEPGTGPAPEGTQGGLALSGIAAEFDETGTIAAAIPCPTDPPIPTSVCPTLPGCTLPVLTDSMAFEGCIVYENPTTLTEQFWFQIPMSATGPIPLVVVLHGYGGGHCQIPCKTDFDAEADLRGWAVIGPRGGITTTGWNNPTSQDAVIRAMDRLEAFLQDPVQAALYGFQTTTIDRDRVYAAGWSMGGGWALSMAERYLDPNGWRFAAVLQNAGALDLIDVYNNDPSQQLVMPQVFDTTPAVDPFPYQQASAYYAADPAKSMYTNLRHVPVFTLYSTCDRTGVACANGATCSADSCPPSLPQCQGYLPPQSEAWLPAHLALGGGFALQAMGATTCDDGVGGCFQPFGGTNHDWCLMDASLVCSWFDQFVLAASPSTFTVTADRAARFYSIDVVPVQPTPDEASGVFAHVSGTVSGSSLTLAAMDGLDSATVHLDDPQIAFDPEAGFTVSTEVLDGGGTLLLLDSPCSATQNAFPLVFTILHDGTALGGTYWNPFPTRLAIPLPFGVTTSHTYSIVPNDPLGSIRVSGQPLFGQTITVDVDGQAPFAGRPYLLVVTATPLTVPIPMGTGALGASSLQVLPQFFVSGVLDRNGAGSVPIPIPNVAFPSFVKGLFIWFQGLVLSDAGIIEPTPPAAVVLSDVDPCP